MNSTDILLALLRRVGVNSPGWWLLPPPHVTRTFVLRLLRSTLTLATLALSIYFLSPFLQPYLASISLSTWQVLVSLEAGASKTLDLPILLAVLVGAATSLAVNVLLQWGTARARGGAGAGGAPGGVAGGAGAGAVAGVAGQGVAGAGGNQPFDIPDNACYFCIRRPATSKCGSCRLVYYCCRLCQMQAWRKHRHVCGAAAAAALRIHRSRSLVSPSQWRDLTDYCDHVRALIPPSVIVPTAPEVVAEILGKIGTYVRARPEIVCQAMADAVWAAALSMRSEGTPDRLHMAWAWGFLEASVESGSADAFLAALRIEEGGAADLPRVNRWMRRGLCQALLMLNKRQEVGAFFRAAPRQQLLYF